jgi:saccharopine dehydrogenase-like NADP-dependent oxidoreductase
MRLLRDLGFFDNAAVTLRDGRSVAPLELTSTLLERVWRLKPGEEEFTVMRVEVQGTLAGNSIVRSCDLLDRTDPQTGDSSMARTTGWPAILAARLLLAGGWQRPGVSAPELLGLDDHAWEFILAGVVDAGLSLDFSPDVMG